MSRILIIESDSAEGHRLETLLQAEGHETILTLDASAVPSLARAHRPELVLWAVNLADPTCSTAVQTCHHSPDLTLVPFILLGEQVGEQSFRQGMELGVDDYLTKPVSDGELITAIATRLHKQTAIAERYGTVLRHTAERLNRLSYYDSLTDLPNYQLFHQRLEQAIATARQHTAPVALLCLSLDRLRQVNNTMGYPAGDSVLQAASQRLSATLPDDLTVARLTGNQFAIFIPNAVDQQAIRTLAERLMDCLSQPFSVSGREVFLTTSIGVALWSHDSGDIGTLLQQADAALESAKHQKSNYCQFFRPDMPVVSSDQIVLETWLRYALVRDEFELYYQPQVNLQTGLVEGAETLIRWCHPTEGFISPGRFVPLAEETGLIVPIGDWVLRQACQQTQEWLQLQTCPLQISVNLSSVQFNQSHLSQRVAEILQSFQLPPHQLELEITETALMQDAPAALATLSELKALGIRIAIDDFGTGYSSLSYLKQFPIDTLKIDNCFVRSIHQDPKNQAILRAVIAMAHDLDLLVIAEGVETEEDLTFLQEHRCDVVQGFLFGKPMPTAQMSTLIGQRSPIWEELQPNSPVRVSQPFL